MRREYLQIQLPEKCEEDWNEMQAVEGGRHCATCQKCVVDFSVMTDNELFRYFKAHNHESICGQFAPHQLDRNIGQVVERKDPFSVFKLAASIFFGGLFLLPKLTKAQTHPIVQVEKGVAAKDSRQVNISGTVTDAHGKPLTKVEVIFGCGDSVFTDTLGNYNYEYTGSKPMMSLKVLNSENHQLHEEQLVLSRLAVGECSNLKKDVIVPGPGQVVIEPLDIYERVYGGIAPHHFTTVTPQTPLIDTLGFLVDSLTFWKPSPSNQKTTEKPLASQSTYNRLRSRVASVLQGEALQLELRSNEPSSKNAELEVSEQGSGAKD